MSGLSSEQQQFIAYRLSGMSVEQAAKTLDITPRTGYRWMNHQAVLNALAAPAALELQQDAPHGPISAELLPYVHEDELVAIDTILARTQERKAEAEEKITPIRKQA